MNKLYEANSYIEKNVQFAEKLKGEREREKEGGKRPREIDREGGKRPREIDREGGKRPREIDRERD